MPDRKSIRSYVDRVVGIDRSLAPTVDDFRIANLELDQTLRSAEVAAQSYIDYVRTTHLGASPYDEDLIFEPPLSQDPTASFRLTFFVRQCMKVRQLVAASLKVEPELPAGFTAESHIARAVIYQDAQLKVEAHHETTSARELVAPHRALVAVAPDSSADAVASSNVFEEPRVTISIPEHWSARQKSRLAAAAKTLAEVEAGEKTASAELSSAFSTFNDAAEWIAIDELDLEGKVRNEAADLRQRKKAIVSFFNDEALLKAGQEVSTLRARHSSWEFRVTATVTTLVAAGFSALAGLDAGLTAAAEELLVGIATTVVGGAFATGNATINSRVNRLIPRYKRELVSVEQELARQAVLSSPGRQKLSTLKTDFQRAREVVADQLVENFVAFVGPQEVRRIGVGSFLLNSRSGGPNRMAVARELVRINQGSRYLTRDNFLDSGSTFDYSLGAQDQELLARYSASLEVAPSVVSAPSEPALPNSPAKPGRVVDPPSQISYF